MGADSVTLKDKYLDWAYRSSGYKKARAVFKRYTQTCVAVMSLSTPYSTPHIWTTRIIDRLRDKSKSLLSSYTLWKILKREKEVTNNSL